MRKIAAGLGTIGLLLCLGTQTGLAQRGGHGGGGGGHFGGGGGGHFGGGGLGHFGGGGMGHFGGISHFGGAGRPLGGVTHFGGPRFSHFHAAPRVTHFGRTFSHGVHGTIHHPIERAARTPHVPEAHLGRVNPRNFAAHRHFAEGALHPFLGHRWDRWHRFNHLGWVGPLFWPYAFGDFFYCGLWPYDYCYYDPFWDYGYADIYEGIFWPYDYEEYVQGPRAPARMTALTQSVAQSCTDEAGEVTGWPIDQIQAALQPTAQQTPLLDDLGNAIVKASDVIKAHCPTTVSFTPTGRIAQMQDRLDGMVQAVDIVQPPLAKFYDSLTDEQKARFNEIGAAQGKPSGEQPPQGQQGAQNPQAECGQSDVTFPTDRIEQVVHPNDAQRAKLEALQEANAKAADLIKASCPSELPSTPPDRLAAEGKHLQAMLQAIELIRPALDDFYNALSDDQKAQFNNLGRQLSAANEK